MEQKIQELTSKIYQEGVQKGEEKAREIVREAEEQSKKIIASAHQSADKIIAEAKQKAEDLRRNIETELRLASAQAISVVKDQIVNMVTAQHVDQQVSLALSHPDFVKETIKLLVQNWKASDGEGVDLEVLLPENKRDDLEKVFMGNIQDSLSRGVTIRYSKNISSGFQIGPSGSSFKVSLTDEDFKEFFKEYLRPRTKAFLFGE